MDFNVDNSNMVYFNGVRYTHSILSVTILNYALSVTHLTERKNN